MKYGIDTVVGGFASNVRNPLPYAIARTLIEIEDLRSLIPGGAVAEFGCGYGRLMSLSNVGFERDDELRGIAIDIGYDARPFPVTGTYDTGITFTFLQHLTAKEVVAMAEQISGAVTGTLIFCEQTDIKDKGCDSRTVGEYEAFFPAFKLVHTQPRRIECERTGTGEYMIFQKI